MPGLLKEDLTAFGSSDLLSSSPLLDSLLSRHYHQLQHLRQQQENSSADAILKDAAASYCSSPRSFLHAGGNGGLNGMNPTSRFMDFGPGKEEILLASPGRSSNSSNSNSIGLNLDLKELQQAAAVAASSGFNPFSDAAGSPCDSPLSTIGALQRFLPSNNEDSWTAEHVYSCDEFRMFEFKVRRCMRGRSHDWTECPFAHPGEKARRRDPRRFHYSGTACPDFRKGHCKNGDACELAHGVFECWLHPARYRTQPCKDGRNCKRRVCFFAHTPEQLRLPPPPPPPSSKAEQNALLEQLMIQQQQQGFERSYDGFLGENHRFLQQQSSVAASPTSTLVGLAQSPPPLSPPLSPGSSSESPPMSPCSPSPQHQQAMAAAVARNVALLRASSPHLAAHAQAAHQAQAEAQAAFLAAAASAPPPSQRQLERINSMPGAALSAAMSAEQRSRLLGFSNSFNGRPNVNSLVAALRQMELKSEGAAYSAPTAACCGGYSACSSSSPSPPASPSWLPATGRSPLYRSSDCGRSTVSALARQQQQMYPEDAARVESGRDLRAKVYGKISMENLPDSADCPDLGWVSELVTEN